MCAAAATVVVDTYGFALTGLTPSEQSARERSLARATRGGSWEKFLARGVEGGTYKRGGRRLKELVRRGIPPKDRPLVWMALSGAEMRQSEYPVHYYAELLRQIDPTEAEGIDDETLRIFAQRLGVEGMEVVRRVLVAFGVHKEMTMHGCGGIASIVAFLTVVFGADREEDVFWMFLTLVEKMLLNSASNEFSLWCRVQERVSGALLRKKNASLADQIEKLVTLRKICDSWFSSLFVMTFPSETVARIWDCLWCEGPKVLHRIALTALNRQQNTILSMSHSMTLPKILTYKLRRTFDADMLMSAAFRSVGSMPSAMIQWTSQQAEREIRGEPLMPINRSWKRKLYPMMHNK